MFMTFRPMSAVLLCVVLCILSPVGCNSIPPEYRAFIELSPERQREVMEGLPIEKQIDYYLAGVTYTHPPLLGLGDHIAKRGKEAIPALVKRLKDEDKEFRKVALIEVFEDMDRFYYDLTGNQEVIEALKKTTAQLKDPSHRARAEGLTDSIMSEQPSDPKKKLNEMIEGMKKP